MITTLAWALHFCSFFALLAALNFLLQRLCRIENMVQSLWRNQWTRSTQRDASADAVPSDLQHRQEPAPPGVPDPSSRAQCCAPWSTKGVFCHGGKIATTEGTEHTEKGGNDHDDIELTESQITNIKNYWKNEGDGHDEEPT